MNEAISAALVLLAATMVAWVPALADWLEGAYLAAWDDSGRLLWCVGNREAAQAAADEDAV